MIQYQVSACIFRILWTKIAGIKYFRHFGYQLVTQVVWKFIEPESFERGTVRLCDINLVAPEAQTDPIPSVTLHFYEQNWNLTVTDKTFYENIPKIASKLPVSCYQIFYCAINPNSLVNICNKKTFLHKMCQRSNNWLQLVKQCSGNQPQKLIRRKSHKCTSTVEKKKQC